MATRTSPAAPRLDAEAAIRRTIADAERLQSDLEPFLALHTDDVAIVNIAGRRVLGRDAFREAMAGALASPLAQVTTTIDVDDVRFVRPDVAIVSCVKHVTDERDPAPDAGELPTSGSLTYVLVDDDGWKIALAQTTPIRT